MTIFIPRTIRVGYQNRSGTYTGKLAYVIYLDERNRVRKEVSWERWRDKKIDPHDFANEPIRGFVLNKKAGGYSTGWNHRQTYSRVYDPRGFEFEITMENLLYVLDNVSSIKGKGLDGEFVYAWDSGELLLIPVDAPDYEEHKTFSEKKFREDTFKSKDLILGAVYRTKNNKKAMYMGRFNLYEDRHWRNDVGKDKGKRYFFWVFDSKKRSDEFRAVSSVGRFVIGTVNKDPAANYAEIMERLEHRGIYSPFSHFKYVLISREEYKEAVPYRAYIKVAQEYHEVSGLTYYHPARYTKHPLKQYLSKIPDDANPRDYCDYVDFYRRIRILANGNVEGDK